MTDEAKGPKRVSLAYRIKHSMAQWYNDIGPGYVKIDYVRLDILRRVIETRDAYDASFSAWTLRPDVRALYTAWLDAMNEARKAIGP